jgi:hypothetical protein
LNPTTFRSLAPQPTYATSSHAFSESRSTIQVRSGRIVGDSWHNHVTKVDPGGIIKESVARITLFRIVAVLLLLIAGAEVYACDISDACVRGAADPTSQQSSDCDQPTGDLCLCCCHHVVPVATFVLEPAERLFEKPVPPLMPHLASQPAHIDHPPQL